MKLSHILFISLLVAALLTVLSNTSLNKHILKNVYGQNKLTGKFYTVNGFQMYCEIYGAGEPLLMIHGNGGSIAAFSEQIPFFAKHYNVIVADSRAQGRSIDHSDSLSNELMADDFATLLNALHLDSVNVLGWSDGGINGLLLAMRHPEKVKKLIISVANLKPDSTAIEGRLLQEITPGFLELKKHILDGSSKSFDDSTVFKLQRLLIEQPQIEQSSLQQIKAPTLVISGDRDLIKPEHTVQIFKNIPNAQLWIIPNCGHATLIDYAKEFNEKAIHFFKTPFRKKELEF